MTKTKAIPFAKGDVVQSKTTDALVKVDRIADDGLTFAGTCFGYANRPPQPKRFHVNWHGWNAENFAKTAQAI